VEALLRIPKRCCNLDTFRTSGRRLRAGSDADVTDVSTVTVVTTVTAMTAVTWHELQHVTCAELCSSLFRSLVFIPGSSFNYIFLRNPLLEALHSSIDSRTPNPQSLNCTKRLLFSTIQTRPFLCITSHPSGLCSCLGR
jgi:hypothetical protein